MVCSSLIILNKILRRVWKSADETKTRLQILLPRNRVESALKDIHARTEGEQFCFSTILEKVKEQFYWANCTGDVVDWCRRCVVRASSEGPKTRRIGENTKVQSWCSLRTDSD